MMSNIKSAATALIRIICTKIPIDTSIAIGQAIEIAISQQDRSVKGIVRDIQTEPEGICNIYVEIDGIAFKNSIGNIANAEESIIVIIDDEKLQGRIEIHPDEEAAPQDSVAVVEATVRLIRRS